jgi:hypothetical protein
MPFDDRRCRNLSRKTSSATRMADRDEIFGMYSQAAIPAIFESSCCSSHTTAVPPSADRNPKMIFSHFSLSTPTFGLSWFS